MRYDRNGIFSDEDMALLKGSKVCVVGCGGLGGYIIEMMGRVGVGHITAIDGDVFDETNLNRQLLSDSFNIGTSKAESARFRMENVNPEVEVVVKNKFLTVENAKSLIENHDIVMDALDSIEMRLILQEACESLSIPFVHGAIAGWYGQVSTVLPGDRTLDLIYGGGQKEGAESRLGNPSFTPATIASIQVSEGLKVLLEKETILRGKLLYIDLLQNDFQTIDLF